MAERERLTNRERRERARVERRRKEAEQASRRKRGRIKSGLATFAVVGVVAAVLIQAFVGGTPSLDSAIVVASEDIDRHRDDAGCEVLADRSPLPDRSHVEANQAPNLDTVYVDTRPTHSGPHTPRTHPVTAAASSQISEFATTHNLEHGSVIVWWDPDRIDRATANAIGDWAELLNDNGFRRDAGGAGILTSPYEDPGIATDSAVALRAWGTAMDCAVWDEEVANAFVLENFGARGIAPEGAIGGFPDGVLIHDDGDASS